MLHVISVILEYRMDGRNFFCQANSWVTVFVLHVHSALSLGVKSTKFGTQIEQNMLNHI